jgi:hypothetical protein
MGFVEVIELKFRLKKGKGSELYGCDWSYASSWRGCGFAC